MSAAHETEPLLDAEHGVRDAGPGRMRRFARAFHDTVLKPLGRPNVYRPVFLALAILNVLALVRFFVRARPAPPTHLLDRVCDTPGCVHAAHGLLHAMNRSADPCDDFYEFATGGWRASHPIPGDQGLFGVGQFVQASNNEVLRGVLEHAAPASHADRETLAKLRTFYGACMDTDAQDAAGPAPLLDEVHALYRKLHTSSDAPLTHALVWLHRRGVPALFASAVDGDAGRAPLAATPQLAPDGLGLPDATYYDDEALRARYRGLIAQAVVEVVRGARPDAPRVFDAHADAIADAVLGFERALAQITPSAVELSDPVGTYHLLSRTDLAKLAPALDWPAYLASMSTSGVAPHKAVVASPTYLAQLSVLLAQTPAPTVHAYLYWTVVRAHGALLGARVPLGEPARRLGRLVSGVADDAAEDRATTCLEALTASLGYASGRFFAAAAFRAESKTQVEDLLATIRDAFEHKLPRLAWLDAPTRAAARRKAEAITIKVGYPTDPDATSAAAVRDYYRALNVSRAHFANMVAAQRFAVRTAWSRIGGALNTGALGDLMPSEVNAEYIPQQNEIVIPAGLLQPPYFDARWPMYLQYGALGTTAGHELSHAFDPAGRRYDEAGFLRDWWTPRTARAFEARQQCVEAQYGNATVVGPHGETYALQSNFTIGEDVADGGGLAQSHAAWHARLAEGTLDVHGRNQRLPGLTEFTQEQLFFLAYGAAWARNLRAAEAVRRLRTDPHSPTQYRVNLPLANFPPFARAFGCRPGRDAMARRADERCEIW